ncbi:MAG: hypothetical protein AAFR00_12650 [Pseudomonadota bacterium]
MAPTETTLLAMILILIPMWLGPERGIWALMVSIPLGVAAAFNLPALGNASVMVADFVAAAVAGLVLLRLLVVERALEAPLQPFAWWILAMIVFCVFITVLGPRLYENQIEVFTMGQTRDQEFIVRTKLEPNSKNISQLFRFGISLSIGLAIMIASPRKISQSFLPAVIAMTAVHMVLSLLDYATFAIGRPDLLDVIRNANYSVLYNHQIQGMKRIIGGFAEAAAAGNFSLGLFGFWFMYWLQGGTSRFGLAFAVLTFLTVLASGSSAAFVGLALFLSIAGTSTLFQGHSKLVTRRNWLLFTVFAALPTLAVGIWIVAATNETFSAYFDQLLFSKLESDSGVERMEWNMHALEAAFEANLTGLGLGSIRSSNFIIACLATLGAIGSAIYLGLLTTLAVSRPIGPPTSERVIISHACRGGCLALLCKAIITKSSPDLEVIFFVFAAAAVLLRWPIREAVTAAIKDRGGSSNRFGRRRSLAFGR